MTHVLSISSSTPLTPSATIGAELTQFITDSRWPRSIQDAFLTCLQTSPTHCKKLCLLFADPSLFKQCIPLIAYHEKKHAFIIIYADPTPPPQDYGEPGSVLAYFRAYGYEDAYLCSDCYGQLSCSSCAIEVHHGHPANPTPRDEEYDMISIDDEKLATNDTRLSCQTCVGTGPLLLTIRA